MEKIVDCDGCTACCEWQGDASISPVLEAVEVGYETMMFEGERRIAMSKETGNCIYLGPDGCRIWHMRPQFCREFDCRVVWDEASKSPLVRMCVAAELLNRGKSPCK